MPREFHFQEGASNKFWIIQLEGTSFTVRFGRIGTDGQAQVKEFPSEAVAQVAHDKLVAEKIKKGYKEVTGSPSETPSEPRVQEPATPAPKAAKKPSDKAKFNLEQRVQLGTDGASFLLFHPDDFSDNPERPAESMSHDFAWKKEAGAGRIIGFCTGGDGQFSFRITSGPLTERERSWQAGSAEFLYTVRHGEVLLDNGCGYAHFWFEVPNGHYRVTIHALAWSEEPGADDRDPQENLPSYVIRFEPIKDPGVVKTLPGPPRLDGILGSKPETVQNYVPREQTEPLTKKSYFLLVEPQVLVVPTCDVSVSVANDLYEKLHAEILETMDPNTAEGGYIVLAPSQDVPTTAALVESCGAGRVGKGPWSVGFRGKQLVTITGHIRKKGQLFATVEPFQRPAANPQPKEVAALKADFANYARTKPRGLKIDNLKFELERIEANPSPQEVVWWLLGTLPLPAEERNQLTTHSLADQVTSLRTWLTAPARANEVRQVRTSTNKDHEFLQAISEDPDADAPRLVYADWLEELGDPRSTFIRVQCELARLTESDPRYKELDKQADELLEEHRKDWEEPLRKLGCSCRFSRGFVSRITLTVKQFLKNAKRIFDQSPIQGLELKQLNRRTNESLRELVVLPQLRRLRRLDLLEGGLDDESARILAGSANLANLSVLRLLYSQIGAAGVKALTTSPHLAQLTHLDLDVSPLGSAGAQALAASLTVRSLSKLSLGGTEIGDDGVQALAASPVLDSVSALHLSGNDITAKGAEALGNSPHLGNLVVLMLHRNKIGDRGVAALVNSKRLRKLTSLDISQNEITTEGVRAIAAAPSVAALEELELGGNHIDDAGATILAGSAHLENIKRLNLFMTHISDRGVTVLKKRFGDRVTGFYD